MGLYRKPAFFLPALSMSVLDLLYKVHLEIEQLERASVSQLLKQNKQHKHQLLQEVRVNDYITKIQEKLKLLRELYNDEMLDEELKEITNNEQSFYVRLKSIKDEFKNVEGTRVMPFDPDNTGKDLEFEFQELESMFTGEEGLGRHLDLNDLYLQYLNLPIHHKHQIKDSEKESISKAKKSGKNENDGKISYLQYLTNFDKFHDINQSIKSSIAYKTYVENIFNYLKGFFARAQPLFDINDYIDTAKLEFTEKWQEGTVKGWPKPNLDQINLELYCIPCRKQFSKQTIFDSHLDGKKHKKAVVNNNGHSENNEKIIENAVKSNYDHCMDIAMVEFLAAKLTAGLSSVRDDTRSYVERKQTLTDKERVIMN